MLKELLEALFELPVSHLDFVSDPEFYIKRFLWDYFHLQTLKFPVVYLMVFHECKNGLNLVEQLGVLLDNGGKILV